MLGTGTWHRLLQLPSCTNHARPTTCRTPVCRDFKAQFALRPQHSDDASQQLVFRMLRDNRLVLVPTDFSGTLQREVETFIDRFRSIPAFTANLTMEYFQKQTQC